MAVNLGKMEKKYEDYKNKRSSSGAFSVEANKSRFIIMLPPHESMDEIPYVENMYHNRNIPKDVKGASFSMRCQRSNYDDTEFSKCWPCGRMLAYRKKRQAKDDEWDKKAGKHAPRRKPISQVIDVTPCMNKRGEIKKELKKCFGKYGKMDDCGEECFLSEVCEKFVQKWYMPIRCWEQFNDHFTDEGDLTDLNKAIPVRIKREGKGQFDTKYESKPFTKSAMNLPSGVQKRIMKSLLDLKLEDPKPQGTPEELKKIYKDFFSLADITASGDDDDDDDDDGGDVKRNPRPLESKKDKKKDKKKKKEKNNKLAKADKEEKSGKKSGKKKDRDKLRSEMRKKAKDGKLNREDKEDDIPY